MGRPVLALDLDDVLADYTYEFITYMATVGVIIRPEDISRSFVEMGIAPVHFAMFENLGHLRDLQMVPGSRDAVRRLATRFELVVVTSRIKAEADTKEWVDRNFPEIRRIIHSRAKGDTCREIGAVGLVDDQIRFAEQIEHAYVLAQPWNAEWIGERGTWEELVPRIMGTIKKENVSDESNE